MARTDTLTNFLTDVASAIKAKKGDNTSIPAANFDTEIANLTSGGGDNSSLINFIERTATSIEIPYGTTSIGKYAFYYYSNLTSVTIPDSVTSIEGNAFQSCSSLTTATIGNGVTSIGASAFQSCSKLASITIPDSVTSIANSVFYYCSGLTTATIGRGVTSIGSYAFSNCSRLTEIDFSTHNSVPTLNNKNAFNNTPVNLVIKVPSALLDEWKAATNWSTYAGKIVGVRL